MKFISLLDFILHYARTSPMNSLPYKSNASSLKVPWFLIHAYKRLFAMNSTLLQILPFYNVGHLFLCKVDIIIIDKVMPLKLNCLFLLLAGKDEDDIIQEEKLQKLDRRKYHKRTRCCDGWTASESYFAWSNVGKESSLTWTGPGSWR